MLMSYSNSQIKKIKVLVSGLFKDDNGSPFNMTDGQAEIFLSIIDPKDKWLWLSAPSRYGKSNILAMAILYLAAVKHLKVPIVGGSEEKARKIMEYVLKHVADHEALYGGLVNTEVEKIEQLKISVSKHGLRWHDNGWIYITSVESRSISKEGEGVVGEGGHVVVLEEAGLIHREEQFSKVVRMAEENSGWGKLIMSGNCIEKSVFEKAFNNPLYKKVRIDLDQAVKEGRFSWEALEQKKTMTTAKDWKRYYLVEFPKAGEFSYFKPKAYEYLPNELKYFGALDPALGESGKGGSLIGVVVMGRAENGQVYEIESHGLTDGPEHAMQFILNLPYKFERFGVEGVMFQRYFKNQMEAKSKELGKYIPFETIEQKQNKLVRIESTEPIVNTGQVLFKKDSILWSHMQEYPDLDKLDVLDTFEMVCRLMGLSGYAAKNDASRIIF